MSLDDNQYYTSLPLVSVKNIVKFLMYVIYCSNLSIFIRSTHLYDVIIWFK